MLKKIKKAKKPFSWFLVICVINFVAFGFIFNVEIKLPQLKISYDSPEVNIEIPEVKADFATTTVTVRNAPPGITDGPREDPVSSTSSPTNIGNDVIFKATASDNESNWYYLIICRSNTVVASTTGGAPTCTGGAAQTICVSGTTTPPTQEASCSHNTAGESSEEYPWYAFVCDNHPSQGDCSGYSQGNINGDGSPYVVNHGPTFTAVNTTVNFQDPGGTFTFTASSSDPDLTRTDTLTLFVCDNDGGATIAGCNTGQLCTNSGAVTDVSCQYTDTAPTPDNAYTYYAYVYDNLGATSTDNYKSSTYTINNVAPSVSSVSLNGGNNIDLNIKNAAEVSVTVRADITDNNHCSDLSGGSSGATSTAYLSGLADGPNCDQDDNDCYQYLTTDCALTNCNGADPMASGATYTCTTTFAFYATPTDIGGHLAESWFARLTAFDNNSAQGSGEYTTPDGVEVIASEALDVLQESIPYNIIKSGQNSGDANATTTIVNYGNTPLNTDVKGSWMTDELDNHIPESQQEWSLSAFTWGAGTSLSSTTAANVNVVIGRPTSQDNVEDDIYWGIGIPATQPSGMYYGSSTFIAAIDNGGVW